MSHDAAVARAPPAIQWVRSIPAHPYPHASVRTHEDTPC